MELESMCNDEKQPKRVKTGNVEEGSAQQDLRHEAVAIDREQQMYPGPSDSRGAAESEEERREKRHSAGRRKVEDCMRAGA
jgi:hypothetical protein